jgi:uncharacterized protein (DUF849 family)
MSNINDSLARNSFVSAGVAELGRVEIAHVHQTTLTHGRQVRGPALHRPALWHIMIDADVPVIVEVRINEMAARGGNPHVPYSAAEIIEEACMAWEAGASILHWHGRDPVTGVPDNSAEAYLAVVEGMRERTDMLLHPTLGYTSQQDPVNRTRHVRAAARQPSMRVDMAPVDFGALNVDYWDPVNRRFETEDQLYRNTRFDIRATLEALRAADCYVSSLCWDIGQIRTARAFQEAGVHSSKTLWTLFFTGESMPVGTPATLLSLQAMLAEMPSGAPWTVVHWLGDAFPIAAWAITLGGHVSIGLGDWHYKRLGSPGHGELVHRLAAMAESLGRPVATPEQTRSILGLPLISSDTPAVPPAT